MKRVYAATNLAEAHLVRESLVSANIGAELRGSGRPGLAGQIPVPDARVEVVVPEAEVARARAVLAGIDARAHLSWVCGTCGEDNPASFETCWKCGA